MTNLCYPKGVAAAVVTFSGRRTVPMAQYEQASTAFGVPNAHLLGECP